MNKKTIVLLAVTFFVFSFRVIAEIRLPSIFTDHMVLQREANVKLWGWAGANRQVVIVTSWNNKKFQVKADGSGRWQTHIPTPVAGGPYEIRFEEEQVLTLKNVLIGEVWLCSGQSNMEMPVKGFKGQPIKGSNETILHAANENIRLYTVPRSSQTTMQVNSKPSSWKVSSPESVADFSATAYHFAHLLHALLKVPVGVINSSYGGSTIEAWMDEQTLKPFPEIILPAKNDSIKSPNRTPTTLYNGMIHPLIGFGIRGVIWYQGESNYERPDQYEALFPALVSQWRNAWGVGAFPFYYAQIAPYNYAQLPPYRVGGKFNSAYLRDAQRKSQDKIPNAAMAVLMDAGNEKNIHPSDKKTAGERLALLALGNTYQLKGFAFESPRYDTLIISGSIAEVKFKNASNWLIASKEEPALFEVAGKDQVFHAARAVIQRSSVLVSSPSVKEPVAVRYAFRDFVVGDLFSTEGLPVSSFRTDNW